MGSKKNSSLSLTERHAEVTITFSFCVAVKARRGGRIEDLPWGIRVEAGPQSWEFDDDLGAAGRIEIACPGTSSMRRGHRPDKGKSQPVAFRFVAFCETLEDMIEKIGGKSGAIVFYPDLRVPLLL